MFFENCSKSSKHSHIYDYIYIEMTYTISILPIFLYLGILMALDSFSLVRWGRLTLAIGSGIASCIVAFLLFSYTNYSECAPAPILEELLKGIVICILIRRKKIAFAIDATIYGAAVGGGFALLENLLYAYYTPDMLIGTAVFRGLGTAIMHMGLTATFSLLLLMFSHRKVDTFIGFIPAIIPSMILHFLFNRFIIEPFIMLAFDLVVFTAIFYFLFLQNQKSIYRWLDNTMESDSRLLAAMKRGEFSGTNAGQYLLTVKEQFKPEVFFDMYCYVKIFLELSLCAKRNLMLSEAGIEVPKDDLIVDNIKEFKNLEKNIGKTGKIALAPIIKVKDVDNWMINSLCVITIMLFLSLIPMQASAQKIYHYDAKNAELLFFDPNTSQYVPHLIKMHSLGTALHNQIWNSAPYDSLCIYKPQKSIMYLTDWEDDGNAGVGVHPFTSIMIGMSPLNQSFYISPSVERYHHLFSHEQTHVVMSDKYTKGDLRWRKFIGSKVAVDPRYPLTAFWSYFTTPRWYSPRWYHEGIACFLETWLDGGVGRALGGYNEMYFRSIIAENEPLFSVVGLETEGTTTDFQVGTNAYLYGTRFVNYLAYQYGVDSLYRFYNRTADSKRFFANQFKTVYGRCVRDVWDDWKKFEKNNQQENLKTIAEYPLTDIEPLVDKPLGSVSPLLYDSKRGVAYAAVNYPGKFAHICSISLETGKMKRITKVDGPMLYQTAYIALDTKEDRLFYTTHNGGIRGLRVYDLKSGRKIKNINYTRMGDIVYDSVRERLYGICNNAGVSSLAYYDSDLNNVHILFSFPFGQSVSDLTVSHSGKHLVATLYGTSGEQKLIRFDVDQLENAVFKYDSLKTIDNTNLSQFRYSLDDSLLIGSSYYTGVSNIWSLNPTTGDMELLSNTSEGLFAPIQISTDSLLALSFGRNGMTPVKMGVSIIKDANAIEYLGQKVFDRNPSLEKLPILQNELDYKFEDVYNKIEEYHPFTALKFSGAYPDVTGYKNTAAVGYRFMFQDPLGLNSLNFYTGTSPWSQNPWKERFHFNLDWKFWGWTLDAYYNNSNFYDLVGPFKTSRAGYKVGLSYNWYYTLLAPFKWNWGVGISTYGMMDALPLFQNIPSPVKEMQTANAHIEISKTRTSLGGVMPESGYRLSLNGYTYLAEKQFFPQLYLEYDQGFLLPLIRNTSFWIRSVVGQSFGDPSSAFGNDYFGGFRNNWVDYRTPYQYRSASALPGTGIDAIHAHSFAKFTGELNLKPIRFKNFGFLGLYPTYAQFSLFSTDLVADAWGSSRSLRNFVNLGAQLNIEVVLFNYLKTTWSVGHAYLLHETLMPGADKVGLSNGQWMFSLKLL